MLHVWLQEHGVIREETTNRLIRLKPFTNEAITFGIHHGLLAIGDDGRLLKTQVRLRDPFEDGTDPRLCRDAAAFVGRWFGKQANTPLLFSLWGIRP